MNIRRPKEKVSDIEYKKTKPSIFAEFKKVKDVDGITKIYEYKKVLGSGCYGTVRKGIHKKTKSVVAIKEMLREKIDCEPRRIERMQNEFEVWYRANHPNIM